ncbi:hypothetical protein AJ78_07379 [Emergomyces pasteurianus Ep9510]|uniref:Cytochrome b561 domain-containing protein n=1 Tax=Emergomyces pasteurianus Ep9510 TaxID=1447872 RepID=A0A1J9P6A6_9EURO|nr:hypothetical protein AJ78_07379 [Emergomyces pasteurianus Ep9510]
MSPSPQLAPPGSSTYSSNTLHVGDGTWDSQRNTFLLPNLMGLNFETMRYNGMGNRFREMAGYHSLIRAHGIIAAITFLCLIPTAILMARFYSPSPYWALRYHIWLHILSLFLSTVVFVLGWFAVGPRRSLTNPHHGIGLAIYVMIIAQTLWGWFVHKRTKGKRLFHVPLKVMLHKWLGRALALLGIVQIPLGLTLYGSPLSLFVLYALAVFTLIVIYFILTYLHERRMGADYDSRGSYMSGPEVVEDGHGRSNLGRLATAGAAGVGLAMLGRRMRNRSRSRTSIDESDITPRPHHDDEKSDHHHGGGGWGKRLFQIGALAGAAGLAKKYFDKRRDRESDTESGRYEPAHGHGHGHGHHDSLYDDSLVQTEEGRPRPSHPRPYDGPPSRPPSIGYTDSGYLEESERGHGVRNTLFGAGAFAALRGIFKSREKKEQERVEALRRQDIENERRARQSANQRRYTGDGQPPPPRRTAGRRDSFSTEMTESTDPRVGPQTGDIPPIPPVHHQTVSGSDTVTSIGGAGGGRGKPPRRSSSGAAAAAAAASAATATANSSRRRRGRDPSVESEPVSINVKFHNDHGRRVTLRRLTPEEAAASRRAKRRDPRHASHRRHGSVSSLSGHEGADDHWRRVEERERMQQEQIASAAAPASTLDPDTGPSPPTPTPIRNHPGFPPPGSGYSGPLPPPPPIPGAAPSSYLNSPPPGSTDLSSHASKRERRRAERRTLSRQGRHNVEFT